MNYKNLSIATIIALIVFAVFPKLDLMVSGLFYKPGEGFIYAYSPVSILIYNSVRVITTLIVLAGLLVILHDSFKKPFPSFSAKILKIMISKIPFSRRQIYFLLLILIITPGIIVHWMIKPEWERARPRQIVEFGGDKQFTGIYDIHAGQDGKSFASGHAATAFSLVALTYMFALHRKKIFIATLSYAIIVSFCRIWQGGHFLSDITFSGLLTLWTIYLMKIFYLERKQRNAK